MDLYVVQMGVLEEVIQIVDLEDVMEEMADLEELEDLIFHI